jgi:hypothetical protein
MSDYGNIGVHRVNDNPFGNGKLTNLFAWNDLLYALVLNESGEDVIMWESKDGFTWEKTDDGGEISFKHNEVPLDFAGSPSVVLSDKVYLIGGSRYNVEFVSNEIYSYGLKNKGGWQKNTASFTPRMGHACVVYNKEIWILGGCDDVSALNDVYHYDGTTWCLEATSLPEPRCMATAAVFKNNIQMFGGFSFIPGDADVLLENAFVYSGHLWASLDWAQDNNSPVSNDGDSKDKLLNACAVAVCKDDLYVIQSYYEKDSMSKTVMRFSSMIKRINESRDAATIDAFEINGDFLMDDFAFSIQAVTFNDVIWLCVVALDDDGNVASKPLRYCDVSDQS